MFHDDLKLKMDNYVHLVYKVTKDFPRDELYGVTSQLRRSALSVILNYIEGYARKSNKVKVYKNFLEISYGSLKESKYLLHFSLTENYMSINDYKEAMKLAEDIGAMLWSTISKIKF
ncbi:MAG: four helix bundle protein [Patescibacteria group bacterium]|nr:four helix bundle protein [Patescibacteria group bacterium]